MNKIRVLVLDDHTILRQSITKVLSAEPDLQAFHCGAVGEALLIVGSGAADVVVLDVDLGTERGVDFLELARRNGFKGPVVVLTAGVTKTEEELLRQQGISAVLLKSASVDGLAKEIRDCFGAPAPAMNTVPRAAPTQPMLFTARESQVLRLVVQGLANKEIARSTDSSESAVKAVLQQLFRKTGTHSRSQLVFVALEHLRDQL